MSDDTPTLPHVAMRLRWAACPSAPISTLSSRPSSSTPTGDVEQYTAFLTIIEEQTPLPAAATLLGAPVTVVGFDFPNEARGLTATCEAAGGAGEVALADLAFPPQAETAWIHAAYRHFLGLAPFPAVPRPDWNLPT
jgi:hypothetical protein